MMTPDATSDGWYWLMVSPSQSPQVGDLYTFIITYADGTQTTQTAAVQGVVSVAPTLTVTQPASGGLSFTWTDVSTQVPNATFYQLSVQDQNGNIIWQNGYSLDNLSATFNDDGTALQQLQGGETYTCSIYIYDQAGNFAYSTATVTMPGHSPASIGLTIELDNYQNYVNDYYVNMSVQGVAIASVDVSGPSISPTSLSPSDPSDPSDGYFGNGLLASQIPQVGDLYTFVVTYTDKTQATQTAAVKGVVTVTPTLTVTQTANDGLAFTWNDVSAQVTTANSYEISIFDASWNYIWGRSYPLNAISGTFNDDGRATQLLQSGQSYTCWFSIDDIYEDCGETMVNETMP